MNGATALVSVKTIRAPKRRSTNTIGSSQYLFLILKNSQNSVNMDWFAMFFSLRYHYRNIYHHRGMLLGLKLKGSPPTHCVRSTHADGRRQKIFCPDDLSGEKLSALRAALMYVVTVESIAFDNRLHAHLRRGWDENTRHADCGACGIRNRHLGEHGRAL